MQGNRERDNSAPGKAAASARGPAAGDADPRGAVDTAFVAASEMEDGSSAFARVGLLAGPILAALAVAATHPGAGALGGLSVDASWVLGIFVFMATWWITLAVDPAITALLPFVLLAVVGLGKPAEIAAPYANDVMFLFAGGSLLALALDRGGVSKRFAAGVIAVAGSSPLMVLAAVMLATALMSAFVSNLATTATMLPFAIALAARVRAGAADEEGRRAASRFATSLFLGIAFASSIGGAMTPVGSPPNPIAIEELEKQGVQMDFLRWMSFSVPATALMLPLSIVVLGVWFFPARGVRVPRETTRPEPLGRDGWLALAVFGCALTAWVTSPLWDEQFKMVREGTVAVSAAAVLFLLPSSARRGEGILAPKDFGQVPWRVLVLFGGGLCLADAMQRTGLSASLGTIFESAGALSAIGVLAVVVAVLVFASEVASNTALSAMAVPIVAAIAPALGLEPQALVIPAVFAASWAFAMPVGTPPNALVFASGQVKARDMMRVGLVLDLVAIAVIVVMAKLLL